MSNTLTLRRPDDWHLHVRDGASLRAVIGFTAAQFARAIIMPNLKPPVTTAELAGAYRKRILEALPAGARFEPLMTLYLTNRTEPAEVDRAKAAGFVHGFKLYPAGATTNSDSGVTDLANIYGVLERMSELGVILQVHGEVTNHDVDVFDREARFIDSVLVPLAQRFPKLRIVFEHITTKQAVEFVRSARDGIGATITPQHLMLNRTAIFTGGIRPHYYCLPVLKKERHRQALVKAATSGNAKFFLGTDSAPHAAAMKEQSVCGAGCYTAPAAMELYAEAFEAAGALDKFEAFASFNGAAFYGLPRNRGTVTLRREPWSLPESLPFGDATIKPLRAGETLNWKLAT